MKKILPFFLIIVLTAKADVDKTIFLYNTKVIQSNEINTTFKKGLEPIIIAGFDEINEHGSWADLALLATLEHAGEMTIKNEAAAIQRNLRNQETQKCIKCQAHGDEIEDIVENRARKIEKEWKNLPQGGVVTIEDMQLGTGEKIKVNKTTFKNLSLEKQVEIITNNDQGVTKEQAEFLINQIKAKNGRIVFGGSKVRGNATSISDLDVGFDGLTQNQLYDIVNKYNKQFYGNSQATLPGAIKDKFILTGNTGKTFPEIKSPEEFFMRSGNRHFLDKNGEAYSPSGYISIDALGNIQLGK